ncbi:hypothetical protein Q7X53_11610, partial [Glaesserella parasuis]|nr:hypothetical protein [Glaesserella parasuis]MDP0402714.1 hypothetical protein [Glaesserella parasuis]
LWITLWFMLLVYYNFNIQGTHCVCPQNKPYPILTTDTQCVPTVNSLKLLQIFGFTVGENYIRPDVTMIIWGKCDLPLVLEYGQKKTPLRVPS